MANYMNIYATQNAYDNDNTKQYPNVSYISGGSVVFANSAPTVFGGLTVHYQISESDTENDIKLFYGWDDGSSSSESSGGGEDVLPTRMIVDGVEETVINSWRFTETGEHIVQFEFEDNVIPVNFIDATVPNARKAEIGDDITEVSETALGASPIEELTIGTGVTMINDYAFIDCESLSSVTVTALLVPQTGSDVFDNNASGRKIYVPASVLADYQQSWSNYASDIEAIQ